nr:hypothetical protein [Tanacetum cinerariifolium]
MCLLLTILRLSTFQKIKLRISLRLTKNFLRLMTIHSLFYNIDYVEASAPDSELVSSEVMEIVIPKVGGIEASNDNPILFYDPIIFGTPPNLTPTGESDFFLESCSDEVVLETIVLKPLCEEEIIPMKSLRTHDSSRPISSKIDSLLDEFAGELTLLLETIVSKPLCEEEIIPMKSLRTHDSSLLIPSKINSLLDEFAGELTLLKSISMGIDETDCDFEEDIRLIEKLLYDNSSSRPPKEFVSANSDAASESFSPSSILVKDSDSLIEEIDLFCERIPRKGQNRIKTGQKREAWRSQEKSKAVTVDKERKTEENIKRRAKYAKSFKVI